MFTELISYEFLGNEPLGGHFDASGLHQTPGERRSKNKKGGGATEHPVSQFETWFVLLNQVIPVFGSAVGWGQIDASGLKL